MGEVPRTGGILEHCYATASSTVRYFLCQVCCQQERCRRLQLTQLIIAFLSLQVFLSLFLMTHPLL